jgi:hypothetical protein
MGEIVHRPVARIGRAAVSKTACWGFESLLACQIQLDIPAEFPENFRD